MTRVARKSAPVIGPRGGPDHLGQRLGQPAAHLRQQLVELDQQVVRRPVGGGLGGRRVDLGRGRRYRATYSASASGGSSAGAASAPQQAADDHQHVPGEQPDVPAGQHARPAEVLERQLGQPVAHQRRLAEQRRGPACRPCHAQPNSSGNVGVQAVRSSDSGIRN